jgi:hypothetical protein
MMKVKENKRMQEEHNAVVMVELWWAYKDGLNDRTQALSLIDWLRRNKKQRVGSNGGAVSGAVHSGAVGGAVGGAIGHRQDEEVEQDDEEDQEEEEEEMTDDDRVDEQKEENRLEDDRYALYEDVSRLGELTGHQFMQIFGRSFSPFYMEY